MRRLFILSAVALCTISLSGCKKGGGIDNTRAQLRIATFDGGVGDQWLKEAAEEFTKLNAERTDFEEGKTGVQIHVFTNRACSGSQLESSDLGEDIYFTENVDYYRLTNLGKLADITDILTSPIEGEGERTILDKIDTNLVNFMNRGTAEQKKLYAVPFYDCFYGLVYDKDLFQEKSLYLKNDGTTFTNNRSEFGTGPNGIAGDWDDGLPKTYDEFKNMMDEMKKPEKKVIPFTYSSGVSTYYTSRALTSYWSDDEGYDQTALNYTFDGLATNIIDTSDYSTKSVQITKNNGYELRAQAGIYNSLRFARDYLCSSANNYIAFDSNFDVQNAFVNKKHETGTNAKAIAMMFEGTWWENEAASAFDEARSSYSETSFNYGFMPIPKSSNGKIGDATLMNLNESFGFISESSENKKLAKEFFKYLHSDEQMRKFTKTTNMTRGLNYKFSESDYEGISTYAQDLVSIKNSDHVKVVYPCSSLDFVINNSAEFSTKSWPWKTDNYTDNPIIKFIDDKSVTAKDYFEDHIHALDQSDWNLIIS